MTRVGCEAEIVRLEAVRSLGLLDTDPEQEFDELAQLAAAICGVPTSLVTLIDDRRQFHKAKVGIIDLQEIPRSTSFCEYTIQQDGVFIVEDALLDDRFRHNPLVRNAPEVRFYAGAPLTTESGMKVGALCVLDVSTRTLNEQQTLALATLARQVVARMELRQKRAALDVTMMKLQKSEERFRAFANNVPFETYLKDATGALAFYNKHLGERFRITPSDWLGKRNSDLWPADVAAELDEQEKLVRQSMAQVESTASTPDGAGAAIHWRLHQVPYETDSGEVWLAGIAIDVTEQMERETRLRDAQHRLQEANNLLSVHALTDELTGLWNRRAFNLRVAQEVAAARRTHAGLGLILLDIDNFKTLNDRFGHSFGDQILRDLGVLLRTHVRLEDTAARYGGEEFVLLVPRVDGVALEVLADRLLRDLFVNKWVVEGVTASLGLASYSESTNTPELLLGSADAALYAAKADGKACWRAHAY